MKGLKKIWAEEGIDSSMGKKTKKEFSEAVCHKNDELTLELGVQMGTPFLSRTHWLEILSEYG